MKAGRWSFTGLEQAENCLKQFHEVRVLKNYPYDAGTAASIEGLRVHKAFENRQATRDPLPDDLAQHEPFMLRMEGWEGEHFFTEQRVALDKNLKRCAFFGKEVWWSGVIDYIKLDFLNRRAKIVDYKTGKRKPKPGQLVQNALFTFHAEPEIDIVDAMFYWTVDAHLGETKSTDRYVYTRDQIPKLWEDFVPALTRLKAAYNTDAWPAKRSGLCSKWCPVLTCEHNGLR